MSKLHQSTKRGFEQISKEQLQQYNNWRAEQYANRKTSKAFWSVLAVIGLFGGVLLELAYPTANAIIATIGGVVLLFSSIMIGVSSIDRD